jgi:hypothetical protein
MIHIRKVCLGKKTIEDLENFQKTEGLLFAQLLGFNVPICRTRNFPVKKDDLIAHGSLYWIFGNKILARQKITNIVQNTDETCSKKCIILLNSDLIAVQPMYCKPFQGWRYLEEKNAPQDIVKDVKYSNLPDNIYDDLANLGIL